jgi:hygromycin-B 7''-O-kinase
VARALKLVALPVHEIEAPFVGTFPTFLVGDLVVKIFGPRFEGYDCCRGELAMHELLAKHPEIPAPSVVAHGALFGEEWPFLIQERFRGTALRDATPTPRVTEQLGRAIARLHALPPPPEVRSAARLQKLRAAASVRARGFGMPEHLVAQIPDYLADALPATTLIHADLTNDHIFIHDGQLEGVIDWGDAMVADPFYELVPLRCDPPGDDPAWMRGFLDGYGWAIADDFARRAMQAVLSFEFGAIRRVGQLVDLARIATLEELGLVLFDTLS